MNIHKLKVGLAACALIAAPIASADDVSGFTIVPGFGYYDFDQDNGLESDVFGSLGLGYQFNNRWTTELSGAQVLTNSEVGTMPKVDLNLYRLDALYTVNPEDAVQGYFVIGGGHAEYDTQGAADEVEETIANYGFGLKYAVDDRLALRGDLRGITSLDEERTDVAVTMAISYLFAQTSRTVKDADGDGVSDKLDQCPSTPAGVQVDEKGCALDSDGDGVANHMDDCPNTPAGVQVNERGCAADDDGDGVPNHKDECPDTQAGATVDEKGCYVVITEDVKVELDVEFDNNSAASRPEHRSEVERVASFMRKHPLTQVLVEGHTDDRGSAAYNQQLSERRAATIATQLVNEFGVEAARVRSVGVGESRPRADNATAEGRQRNRRVVAVVSARVERRDN